MRISFLAAGLVLALHVSADVVIDATSEIVMAPFAPYATRLAAEELNFFLKGVLGAPLPVVAEQTQGRTAIALGCGRDGLHRVQVEDEGCPSLSRLGQSRPPEARDGFVIEATNGTVRICGNDDDVPDGNVTNTCWYGNEAPWQPHFRRGTLFGVYEFLERHAGVRCRYPSCACG